MDFKLPQLDGIMDRLGFREPSRVDTAPRRFGAVDDGYEDEYYDEYEDYGEYGYDEGEQYDDYPQDGYREPVDPAPAPRHMSTASSPKLVTAEDVRAFTQYTPPVDEHYHESRAERMASARELGGLVQEEQRSPGLNGLFVPTTPAPSAPGRSMVGSAADEFRSQRAALYSTPERSAAAPAPAPATASAPAPEPQAPSRILTVLKPVKYDEAERVVRIVKTGDVAVISLRNTQENLGKRLMDFCFGVAAALDAQVEVVSPKVYAICRGNGLSETEKTRLHDQGL